MPTSQPFTLDQEYLQQVQSDPNNDYLSDIQSQEIAAPTTTGTVTTQPPEHEPKHNNPLEPGGTLSWIAVAIVAVVVALVLWKIVKKALAPSDDELEGLDRQMGEDTITGHSWQDEISQLMADGNYSEVVVLCYLRRLERLDADNIIRFRSYKTPGMFLAEASKNMRASQLPDAETRIDALRQLTNNYLRVRYGHYAADAATANKMLAL